MYEFAIFVFLALVVWKAGDLVNLWSIRNRPLETLILLGLGVGAVEALQWNLLRAYHQDINAVWLGVVATGLAVGSAASFMRTASDLIHAVIHRVNGEVVPLQRKMSAA